MPLSLILLDINMPVMNGWEFLEAYIPLFADKLPQISDYIPFLLPLTLKTFPGLKSSPVVAQFVSKPLSVENLAELKENEFVQQFF